jgi:hypothetical protein
MISLLKLGVVLLIIDWENLVLDYVKMFGGFGMDLLHMINGEYSLNMITLLDHDLFDEPLNASSHA